MSGQEIVQKTPMQQVLAAVRSDQFKSQIANALPGNVTPERFIRFAVTAIQQMPSLIAADRDSLYQSIVRCAQTGLLPDGREAALVEVKIKGEKKVQFWPMVAGYRKIAAKHDMSLEAFVVYERDEFDYQLGFEPTVTHKPPKLGMERGQPVGAYALARHKDGRKWLDVMSLGEIEKVRAVSRAATSEYGPWVNWWDRQACKTVARRLFKTLPLDDLEERESSILEAGDNDAELPAVEKRMTEAEANVHAALGNGGIPADQPPDDGEHADEADWSDAVEADPGPELPRGEEQVAFQIPQSAQKEQA